MKQVLIVKSYTDESQRVKAMRKAKYAPSIARAAEILNRDASTVSRAVSGDRGMYQVNGHFVIEV